MARYVAVGIMVWLVGLRPFADRIQSQPQPTSQASAQTFLQNIQRLELINRWGQPVDGLRMSILKDDEDDAELSNDPALEKEARMIDDCAELGGLHCGPDPSSSQAPHGKKIHLLLEIRNDGDQEAKIIIGGGCGIRATGVTANVSLSLTDSSGTSFPLHFLGIGPPYQAGCFGAMGVLSVTIGAHKSFVSVLDLGKYINLSDNQSYSGMYHLAASTYEIEAQLELRTFAPGGGARNFGTLASNAIQVQFDSDFSFLYFPKHVAR